MTNELKKAIETVKEYLDMDSDVDSEYLNAQRTIIKALESAIHIPNNKTNGDVIKAMFPRIKHSFTDKDAKGYLLEPNDILTPILTAFDSWWDAPYKAESEDAE